MIKILKDNYKFIIILILTAILFWLPLPYYIDAPGGLTKLNDKININNKKINGSYNLVYVSEYKASIPLLIYSLINKDYDIYKKKDVLLENESDKEYNKRDELFLQESLSNAVVCAYNLAGKNVAKKNNYLYVGYILESSNTSLEVGDSIVSINGVSVHTKKEINELLNRMQPNKKINIEVINNKKKYNRYAYIKKSKGRNIIGIIPIEVYDYETNPKVNIKTSSSESGGSGGFMLALSIYDLLSDNDLARNRVIAGTGTIDIYGNVGEIGGIKYKIKGAVKNDVDIFFVPKDNYKEAIKIVKKNNYKLKLVKINNIKEAINYLENR